MYLFFLWVSGVNIWKITFYEFVVYYLDILIDVTIVPEKIRSF